MKTIYNVAEDNKTLLAERTLPADVARVWEAWTTSDLLDQWWGPAPYKAITQSLSFTEGGEWRYYMEGPEGDRHWCINTYRTINLHAEFMAEDAFSNEAGVIDTSLPVSQWRVQFLPIEEGTRVLVTTTYATEADLETVVKMGMKEGFNQGLDQLEALLTS